MEAVEKILFRSSSFGNLMVENKDCNITEKQAETIKDFSGRLKLTANQTEELARLIAKRDAPPDLSATAKEEVEKIWRLIEKGYADDLDSKFLTKGLLNEQDGIGMVSLLEDDFYVKNNERITVDHLTGECDVLVKDKRIVKDIKCSWDLKTFMKAKLSKLYEYQGRCYMMLYDCDEFHLHYCLTDTPEHIIENECKKAYFKYYDPNLSPADMEIFEQNIALLQQQIRNNLTYTESGKYTEAERVKTFIVKRDKEIEKKMLDKIPLALEYYKTITTNNIR